MLEFVEALNLNSEDVAPVLVFSIFILGFFAYKIAGRLFEAMEKDAAMEASRTSQASSSGDARAEDVQRAEIQAAVREATAPLQRRVDALEEKLRHLRQREENGRENSILEDSTQEDGSPAGDPSSRQGSGDEARLSEGDLEMTLPDETASSRGTASRSRASSVRT